MGSPDGAFGGTTDQTGIGADNVAELDRAGVLLGACARGERTAFERLYRLSGAQLFGIAVRMVGPDDAEEVVQDAFLKIWHSANQFDPTRGVAMAWMATIVRHRAIDLLRKRRPRADLATLDREISPDVDGPLSGLAHGRAGQKLHGCLERLSTSQRDTIVMAYCYGYSFGEIGEKLESPVSTAKSWARRGLAQLKRCLES